MSQSSWWSPERHADRRPMLLARNRAQAAIRGYLAEADFVEVDPPALVVSPGNETHLHAFATQMIGNDGLVHPMYLHTSPEFAMKKLLAAGEARIAAFAHVWRNRERGPRHSPEFTMLEWYRAGEPYEVLMEDVAALARLAVIATGAALMRQGEVTCDPALPYDRLSVAEAFDRFAGIDLLATLTVAGLPDRDALAAQTARAGVVFAPDDTWSDIFSRVLSERVEPKLGIGRITVLDRYPACEAALARLCDDDPREAERFEVYACGVELANGFGELTDPAEQRRRFEADMNERERIYGERYPLDEDFLAALAHMPPASGIAMGFDRLVMLATGAPRISDVLWVPVADT
ncbi:EF-P lysine aminoacylase EpmA [Maritimibacter sp. DP1N21-5]|uniref:EF-P lysine aminoacylase EpmA n=1 Tax=Maritimibacter sp. DP1N21-5 TaxID=2836867 RepID=UPI001C494ED8|nr:EF-P lysine aminoacylase EpmA [Maritimibacter sp. DP1N21-5]MBV7410595.1 EF-P lysine aminoacylase GenX [Maritimibacter sp. DP1N21-5]